MGEARRKWLTGLQNAFAPPDAPPAPAEEPAGPAEATETLLWMLGETPTYQRRIAFTESVGARFGDLTLTARFTLDRWSESPNGFQWTLDPGNPVGAIISPRAEAILSGCFVRVRRGLCKRAIAEYGGDVEQAIITAIDEHMTMLGLDRYLPEHAEAAGG